MRVFATCKILNAHLLTSIWWRMRNEKENISLILLPSFWQKHRIKMWRPNFPKLRWGLWWCFLFFCLSVQLWSSVQPRKQNLETLLDSFRIQASEAGRQAALVLVGFGSPSLLILKWRTQRVLAVTSYILKWCPYPNYMTAIILSQGAVLNREWL